VVSSDERVHDVVFAVSGFLIMLRDQELAPVLSQRAESLRGASVEQIGAFDLPVKEEGRSVEKIVTDPKGVDANHPGVEAVLVNGLETQSVRGLRSSRGSIGHVFL
jgi:hypothetical protein